MPEQNHPIRAQRLRVWICVLLGALLLYNPFAALYFSHDTIEVHTLQRNRASRKLCSPGVRARNRSTAIGHCIQSLVAAPTSGVTPL